MPKRPTVTNNEARVDLQAPQIQTPTIQENTEVQTQSPNLQEVTRTEAQTPKLRKGQKKILLLLSKTVGGLTRKDISEMAEIDIAMSDLLGSLKENKRDWGKPSLIDLGFVRPQLVNVDGRKEYLYEITNTGREFISLQKQE